MNDEDGGLLRPVLIGLGALLGVSVLIGGVVSAVALGMASVAGVGGDDPAGRATSAETRLYIPSPSDIPSSSASDEPAEPDESEPTDEPSEPEITKREATEQQITLSASPTSAPTFERIDLRGTYRNANGARLQVQRYEGGWVDFPTTATVQDGTFATYVESGINGQNRFRVVDTSSGRTSKPVSVDIS